MRSGMVGLGPQAALVVAESFSVDAWQRVHLHNLVDGVAVRRLPSRHRLCGCAKVWALPPGTHQGRLRIVDPDGETLSIGASNGLSPAPGLTSCTVLTAFNGVMFRTAGRHELVLDVDGSTVATLPLDVAVGRNGGASLETPPD